MPQNVINNDDAMKQRWNAMETTMDARSVCAHVRRGSGGEGREGACSGRG
jgi:hypothetical protein